jgi:hypothetical protein
VIRERLRDEPIAAAPPQIEPRRRVGEERIVDRARARVARVTRTDASRRPVTSC